MSQNDNPPASAEQALDEIEALTNRLKVLLGCLVEGGPAPAYAAMRIADACERVTSAFPEPMDVTSASTMVDAYLTGAGAVHTQEIWERTRRLMSDGT